MNKKLLLEWGVILPSVITRPPLGGILELTCSYYCFAKMTHVK